MRVKLRASRSRRILRRMQIPPRWILLEKTRVFSLPETVAGASLLNSRRAATHC
jgi:hypothetical protein